jgi:alpha-L-fucosidase
MHTYSPSPSVLRPILRHPYLTRSGIPIALTFAAVAISLPRILAQSGPSASAEIVAQAVAAAPAAAKGRVEPTWDSVRANYHVPDWWRDAKFGIFMHWGLYAVPAHGSEWYELHMYNNPEISKWHAEHWGPQDKFGYKDFIPLFTAAKFDPDAWAALFKKAGAKFIVPTAEHHDGFSLWDSATNKYNAKLMGPKRDLIADLGAAVRRQGLKFGVSNHSIEHFTFVREGAGTVNDLRDPSWADFYAVADRSEAAKEKFLERWVAKNFELIDQYQPDLLWFDNGVNARVLDPLKLKVAQHYYNRAAEWKKDVSISTKGLGDRAAYLAGTLTDFERMSRAPAGLTDYVWQVDEPVLYRFGYTENNPTPIASAGNIVTSLVNNVSKNGALLLNISPKADGTIPDDQQKLLLGIGAWLDVNGEAIYGTRPWKKSGEGALALERGKRYSAADLRFTTKGDTLYAFTFVWPEDGQILVTSLTGEGVPAGLPSDLSAKASATAEALAKEGKVSGVTLLGADKPLEFSQDAAGLHVKLPAAKPCDFAYALKITGLKLK